MGLAILHHLVDLFFTEAARSSDLDGLFFIGAEILGVDMDDPVGVDIKCHLDLRKPSWREWYTDQVKLPQELVVCRHLSLPLMDTDGNSGLIVRSSRKGLTFLSRDGGVFLDELGKHSTQGLNP